MTEKRFIITETGYVYDKKDKGICPTIECVLRLLNELHEENEQLKQRNKTLQKSINDFIKVEEENEELKANCKNYEWYKKYKELLNENEQLKSEINMLKTTIGRNESYIERLTHKSEWHN